MPILERLWNSNPVLRRMGIVLTHALMWALAFWVAIQLRFEGYYPTIVEQDFARMFPYAMAVLILYRGILFGKSGLFHGMWRYSGIPELRAILGASSLATLGLVLTGVMYAPLRMPRSIYVGEWLASIMMIGGLRFGFRVWRERQIGRVRGDAIATLVVGAGDLGESLVRDLQRDGSRWTVMGFLDDDPRKRDAVVRGVRVLGPADEQTIRRVTGTYDIKLVVLALPQADGPRTRQILRSCRALGVQTKTVPSLPERMSASINSSNLRDVAIDDLLRRDTVSLDIDQVENFLKGRTVLITGGGGSIGSELARQTLRFFPKRLLLLDHDENSLFFIERELKSSFPEAKLEILMGDILDERRISEVFSKFHPEVVFHAAAHKHVPMMEANPCEAIKNNVFGTSLLAEAAHRSGADAFVLISTDKAVNPTSVMGASKRVAEMVIQQRSRGSSTRFASVRFGNVLGSAGSVVPIFQEQIARGGPVIVTHPEVQRYFMTIPEAAQLVLQAGALGGTGEIFVLDMGNPVKIVDLARDLIELSGLTPDVDIGIEFSGLRPGEKLFEELLHDDEAFGKTPHPKILVGKIQPPTDVTIRTHIDALRDAVQSESQERVPKLLSSLIPEAMLGREHTSLPPAKNKSDSPVAAPSSPLLTA